MEPALYQERKETTLSLIDKAKSIDKNLGEYLEKHISMDDKCRSLMYTGDLKILADLMGKTG
jgi:hypothetical protein